MLNNMSKELEAFKKIMEVYGNTNSLEGTYKDFLIVKKALERLEAIDNAKPNKALEILYNDARIESGWVKERCITYAEEYEHNDRIKPYYDTIKQALIKAQEQEKVLEITFKKRVDLPYLYELFESIKQGKDTIESALKQYNNSVKNGLNTYQLTQEEFNTLKEWLK